MRPGCLSRQCRNPKLKKGLYHQLSYTAQMKSTTEYIDPDLIPQIEPELAEYRRYRELNQEWVELSPPITLGTSATLLGGLPWSSRSGENVRKKPTPSLTLSRS